VTSPFEVHDPGLIDYVEQVIHARLTMGDDARAIAVAVLTGLAAADALIPPLFTIKVKKQEDV
jgi:hypothetical protein